MRITSVCVVILLLAIVFALCVEGAVDAKPCKKAEKKKLLSIEHRYPVLVKDYHPVLNEPLTTITGKEADRAARVIIREHLAWERENPPPPKQLSLDEIRDMKVKIAKQTEEIKDEHKNFKVLAKWVDDDHRTLQEEEVKRKADALAAEKKKALELAAKEKLDREIAASNLKRKLLAAQKKAAEEAKAKLAALKKKAGKR